MFILIKIGKEQECVRKRKERSGTGGYQTGKKGRFSRGEKDMVV